MSRLAIGPNQVVNEPVVGRKRPYLPRDGDSGKCGCACSQQPDALFSGGQASANVRQADAEDHQGQVEEHFDGERPGRPDGVENALLVEDLGEGQVFEQVAPVARQSLLAGEPDHDHGHVVHGEQADCPAGQEASRRDRLAALDG
jgi:hypothetical protein